MTVGDWLLQASWLSSKHELQEVYLAGGQPLAEKLNDHVFI
jgi:hypothetical protein